MLSLFKPKPLEYALLGNQVIGTQDWRVTGKRRGSRSISTSYCNTRGEAHQTRNYMKGAGYRRIRIKRHG